MKRAPWPRDDSPRRKGTRRVRLWFVAWKGEIASVHITHEKAASARMNTRSVMRGDKVVPPVIRRATALVRFVDPAPKETR